MGDTFNLVFAVSALVVVWLLAGREVDEAIVPTVEADECDHCGAFLVAQDGESTCSTCEVWR